MIILGAHYWPGWDCVIRWDSETGLRSEDTVLAVLSHLISKQQKPNKTPPSVSVFVSLVWRWDLMGSSSASSLLSSEEKRREEKNAIRNKSSKIGDVIFWLDNVGTINTDKQKHPLQHMIRRPRLRYFHNSHAGISNPTIAFILVWYEGSVGQ